MSCASESYAPPKVGARPPLRLLAYSGSAVRADIVEGEVRGARSLESGGAQLNASRAVPDTTRPDPEHIWGDEGPVNE